MNATRALTDTLARSFQDDKRSEPHRHDQPPFQQFLEAHAPAGARVPAGDGRHRRRRGLLSGDVHRGAARLRPHGRRPSAGLGDDDRAPQGDRPPPGPGAAARSRASRCPSCRPPADNGRLGDLDGAVWTAVAELGEAQRAAVALRYAGDLAYREIGAALDCSEEAARKRVSDGLRALRETIDREEAAGDEPSRHEADQRSCSAAGSRTTLRRGASGSPTGPTRRAWSTSPTAASTRPLGTGYVAATERGIVSISLPTFGGESFLEHLDRALAAGPRGAAAPRPGAARARRVLRRPPARVRARARLAAGALGVREPRAARDGESAVRGDDQLRRGRRARPAIRAPSAPPEPRSATTRSRSSSPAIGSCGPAECSATTAGGRR